MGNAESNVTSGVKKQTDSEGRPMYRLMNLKGGGLLVDMMKTATKTKDYREVDEAIKTLLKPFMYNGGEGKYVPIAEMVLLRNMDRPRHKQLPIMRNLDDPTEEDIDKLVNSTPAFTENKDPSMYRFTCWDILQRGAVGESCMHLCFLSATAVHAELAKRILRFYPKAINDVYLSEEYFGENVLHMAIVNEDPAMVKYLLDTGANFNERCVGNFMSTEDQKASRHDSLDHEYVDICTETNYEGYVYWGEYPLAFAACLGQEECYRLILAKGADPNAQDTNGNMVLHMLVIHNKISSFDMAYELGADPRIENRQGLTPMTLAAKAAKRDMFFHIVHIEREIYWQIGGITCAGYPLSQIDTIDSTTGKIFKKSALNMIVFGDKEGHLDMMEGVIIDLLHAKWNSFGRRRFYSQFLMFWIYLLISLFCLLMRPGSFSRPVVAAPTTTLLPTTGQPKLPPIRGLTTYTDTNESNSDLNVTIEDVTLPFNLTFENETSTETEGWIKIGQCYMTPSKSQEDSIRLGLEVLMVLGAICYLLGAARECRFLGMSMFVENLATVPSRVTFLCSCVLTVLMMILRMACLPQAEDMVSIVVMIFTAPYFLFFCRGFKTVGPFVVMIYRMIMGDLLRFVTIYLVFVIGFSQAYYIIFLSYHGSDKNPMANAAEAIMSMFLMSLTSFDDYFGNFEKTDHEYIAKFLFVLYMGLVAILLINMLIAMMGNTYQKIAETKNEWQRQWARIVLVVERGVSPAERLRQLMKYSQPLADGGRGLVLRHNMSDEDKEEMKEMMEMKRYHDKAVLKRQKGQNILASGSLSPPTGQKNLNVIH